MGETASDQMMSIVIVGHVDHGKSTIIGRLLADTGSLPQGKLAQVKETCERNAKPFEYAFLIDALKDERSQGITIDSARVFFQSAKRHYLIIDAPGHIEFLKNMVTGASRAEAALLVIDAQEGIRENSLRHAALLSMLGIRKVVVVINKMDLVDYQEVVFNEICGQFDPFLTGMGLRPQQYIPVSGREGENIVSASHKMGWFQGRTILSALDAFESQPVPDEQPLRMPVQDVYKFTSFGDSRRIVAGLVTSGKVSIGDEVVFYPSGKHSTIKTIEGFNRPAERSIPCGQPAGITLDEQIYVQRGEIIALAGQPAPHTTTRLKVSLFWLSKTPLRLSTDYWFKLATARVKMRVEAIDQVMDAGQDGYHRESAPGEPLEQVGCNEVAECTLKLNRAIAFDLAGEFGDTGRFVIVDRYEIGGGGIVRAALPDSEEVLRGQVMVRNYKWVKSLISPDERAEAYHQRAAMLLITGPQGAGRKRIANLLEADLIASGKFVYFLGIGSVIHGIDADIQEETHAASREEHIRRLAEVAHILLDAGVILIVTAIDFTQHELEMLKTIVNGCAITTVWVGDTRTTDLEVDLQVPVSEAPDLSVNQIKKLLQEQDILFPAA
jgi:bifunctional enzyme CysN/CysC